MKTPTEQGDLIRLLDIDSDFIIDLKYSTKDNFTKTKIYSSNECYINKNTACLLIMARDIFKSAGFKVKIWDAYRPISAQKKFWEIIQDDRFVAQPPNMENIVAFRPTHLNGLCVDITLVNMDGTPVPMPSDFDDFSGRAGLSCKTIPENQRQNAEYMRDVMESVGFQGYEAEWWHFYDVTTTPVPFMDFPI